MFDDSLNHEAHAFMAVRALRAVPAIDAFADPVARAWCRSFGVAGSATAVDRLRGLLGDRAVELIGAGVLIDDLAERLDTDAEVLIRRWFARVLGRPVPDTTQALAIVRLAYLEANQDGRWSAAFLDDDAPIIELAADLDAAMIEPTPVVRHRAMPRQSL